MEQDDIHTAKEKSAELDPADFPLELRGDALLAMTRAAVRIQDIDRIITALDGGIRSIGDDADKFSASRIREATKSLGKVRKDLIADFSVLLAFVNYGAETHAPKGKTLAQHFLDRLTRGGSSPRRKSLLPSVPCISPTNVEKAGEKGKA